MRLSRVLTSFFALAAILSTYSLTNAAEPTSEDAKAGDRMTLTIAGVECAFRYCPAGTFTMGSPDNEEGRFGNEAQREVTLTKGFWILETETTQRLWTAVEGSNPSHFVGENHPADSLSQIACQKFVDDCNKLNVAPEGWKFSLPTEAQWEYAFRAGTSDGFAGATIEEIAWYHDNSDKTTRDVAQKKPNAWGIYDMCGNVWEWVLDTSVNYDGPATDPVHFVEGQRCFRGGAYNFYWNFCRAAARFNEVPTLDTDDLGFRFILIKAE